MEEYLHNNCKLKKTQLNIVTIAFQSYLRYRLDIKMSNHPVAQAAPVKATVVSVNAQPHPENRTGPSHLYETGNNIAMLGCKINYFKSNPYVEMVTHRINGDMQTLQARVCKASRCA